jgi:hypothetical protein
MTDRFKSFFAYTGMILAAVLLLVVPTAAAMYDRSAKAEAVVKDRGPLHGENPVFTMVQMKPCADHLAPFCNEWSWCASSPPALSDPYKLWNVYPVGGKDGPALVCEWRRSDR